MVSQAEQNYMMKASEIKKNQLRMFEELLRLIIKFVLMLWVSLIEIYPFWCALDHAKIVLFVAGL